MTITRTREQEIAREIFLLEPNRLKRPSAIKKYIAMKNRVAALSKEAKALRGDAQ